MCTPALSAVFPSIMEGQYAIDSHYTVELKIGTPPRATRLAVDFASTGIKVAINVPQLSRSYSPALGGSDIVHFDGLNFRVPLSFDGGSKAISLGCRDCEGSIGIGAGSNIWLYYKKGIFTAGSVVLDENIIAYSDRSSDKGVFPCLPSQPNYCTTPKIVRATTGFKRDKKFGEITGTVKVEFGFATPKTVVPSWLYAAYTQGRNVQRNADPQEWPDIHLNFGVIPDSGHNNKIKIRSDDLVTRSRRTGYDLLLQVGTDNSTIVLGKNAARSFMFKRDWHSGTGQVVGWEVRKHWSYMALSVMLISSILFVYWKLSPSGEWKPPAQATTFGPFWKLVVSFLGAVLLIFVYAYPTIQESLAGHLDFNVYLGSYIGVVVLWQLFGAALYMFGGSKRILGYEEIPSKGGPPIEETSNFIGSSYSPRRPYTEDGMFPLREPSSSMLPKRLVYLTPRLWVIIGVTNESILLLTLLLVFLETRVESLGNFFTVLISLSLLFNMVYHLIIAMFVSTSDRVIRGKTSRLKTLRWSFMWALFWVSCATLIIIGTILTQIHIVHPFIERHISRFPRLVVYSTVFVYGAGFLLAISWARQRIIYEENTKFMLIKKMFK